MLIRFVIRVLGSDLIDALKGPICTTGTEDVVTGWLQFLRHQRGVILEPLNEFYE